MFVYIYYRSLYAFIIFYILKFICFIAGLACVIPYLPVHAKEIGISAISVGVIYCMLPFFTMLLKPAFGFLADHFNILKNLMTVFLGVIMLSSASTVSIPRKQTMISSVIHCSPTGTNLYFKAKPNRGCDFSALTENPLKCYMHCSECVPFANSTLRNSSLEKLCAQKIHHTADVTTHLEKTNNSSYEFNVKDINIVDRKMNTVCLVNLTFTCKAVCEPVLQECFIGKEEPEYSSEQFLLFLIFASLCVSLSGVATSFSDAICFNELAENGHLYGKQRLWGTIGWGLFSPVAGYMNDLLTGDSFLKAYQPGAILQIVILMYDLYIVSKLKTHNVKYSQNICQDVWKLLSRFKMIAFMLSVFVVGAFTALLWSFLFWHLVVLNGSKTLLGIVPAIQCFIGELPFFFFAGSLISKFGHFNILTLNFVAFGLRFVAYSYISNPWMVLPIELLQGPTYGLFYATMATFANVAALPGTEVTVQGLVGSAFECGKMNINVFKFHYQN